MAWLFLFSGRWPFPSHWPAFYWYWHGHEMVFGFAGAVIAGFLLTSVPNWTGTAALRGAPLVGLVGVWLAGRAALWGVGWLPAAVVAGVDLLFFPLLIAAVAPPIARAGKPRNYPLPLLLLLLFCTNLVMHLQAAGMLGGDLRTTVHLAVYVVVAVVAVISGRITPVFTQTALRRRGRDVQVPSRPVVERLAMLAMVIAVLLDLASEGSRASGLAFLVAAGLLLVRQWSWRFRDALSDPLVWILHVAHAWLVVGFAAKGLSALLGVFPLATAFHALSAGAIGTAVLGVMSRVALGHTGRELRAAPVTVVAYALLLLGALIRVLGPVAVPSAYLQMAVVGGCVWGSAFVLFLVVYAPILTRPRPDGKPG